MSRPTRCITSGLARGGFRPPFDPPEARAPAELADGGLARLPSSRRVVTVDRRVVTAAARVATAGHLATLDARDSPPLSGDVERSTKAGAETPATPY